MFFGCSGCGLSGKALSFFKRLLILRTEGVVVNARTVRRRFQDVSCRNDHRAFSSLHRLCNPALDLARFEEECHDTLRHRTNGHCPSFEIFCIVRQIPLVLLRHMLQLHQRFTLLCLQTAVACNTTSMEIHFNNSFCYANVHFFADQIVWNGIFVPPSLTR